MLTSAEFFESFDEAGFLKPASWTPSWSTTTYSPKVRYFASSDELLDRSMRAQDYAIQYVAEQLPGLKEGEQLTVDGVLFRVRERPELIFDGTVARAAIAKVVTDGAPR